MPVTLLPIEATASSSSFRRRPVIKTWLLSRDLLIWPHSDSAEDHFGRRRIASQCLQRAAPAEIVWQVFRRHAVEAAQPFLQPAMVSVDVVEVVIRRLARWFAGLRQDMRGNTGPARECNDRRAAVAAEFIGWRNNAAQGRGNRYAIQFR